MRGASCALSLSEQRGTLPLTAGALIDAFIRPRVGLAFFATSASRAADLSRLVKRSRRSLSIRNYDKRQWYLGCKTLSGSASAASPLKSPIARV